MALPLYRFPTELASKIGSYLDAASLGALRLTSKSTNNAFTPAFGRLLEVLTVDLSEPALRRIYALAGHPGLGPAVRNLNLVCLYFLERPNEIPERSLSNDVYRHIDGFVNNESDSSPIDVEREAWIKERKSEQAGFQGRQMCTMLTDLFRDDFVNLHTVTLEASVVVDKECRRGPEFIETLYWRHLWTVSVQAYHGLMLALSAAKPRLSRLVIFQQTKICSIPIHDVASFLLVDNGGFATCAAGLEHLSISLATTVTPIRPKADLQDFYRPFDISRGRMLSSHDVNAYVEGDIEGVIRLLGLMPRLKSLHLHLFNTLLGRPPSQYSSFLDLLSDQVSFPSLAELALRGLPASQQTLLSFISKHASLRWLGLEQVGLTGGTWEAFFAALPSQARSLDHIRLGILKNYGRDTDFNIVPEGADLEFPDQKLIPSATQGAILRFRRTFQWMISKTACVWKQ